ncbi:MAG: hypothetical protein A2158_00145 [Chloroflexi bacterium RBG_13_46_14]|nr:MAG: hypothetical protein A2158_00145 [Chloroflexi bacterium RBG_13_46_14]
MAKTYWWGNWAFNKVDETLSILDVIKWGEFDSKLSGLLWLLMEQRPSLIVAAGPSWAGKSTLFHSLLDFLPPDISQVTLRGFEEDFRALEYRKPENTYLITEEISNHSYEYLWGYQVARAFQLVAKGFALGGTIHARNIKEVAHILNAMGVPAPQIAKLGVIITLQVARGRNLDSEPIRYVDMVSTFTTTEDGLVAQILAMRHLPEEKFSYPEEAALQDTLSRKFGVKYDSITKEIERRGEHISQLYKEKATREEVRKVINRIYQSRIT